MSAHPLESPAEKTPSDAGVFSNVIAAARAAGRPLGRLLPGSHRGAENPRGGTVAMPPPQHRADEWVDSMSEPCRCIFVFIGNSPHLAQSFSEDFAAAVSRELRTRLSVFAAATAFHQVTEVREDCFLLWSPDAGPGPGYGGSPSVSENIEHLLADISAEPVRFEGMVALPELHAGWIEVSNPRGMDAAEIDLILWAAQPSPSLEEVRAEDWRTGYRADMAIAVQVWEAARNGRLRTRWQPVVDVYASAATLYRESCVHVVPEPGQHTPSLPGTFMPCLERLRLTRAFDRQVAHQVLETLRQQPGANLGVNLSAHSARLDHWWAVLLEDLAREPLLAKRLVVEIDCARAQVQDAEAVRDFCRCLSAYGCRIAMDAFGPGSAGLTFLQACKPDIVKLEAAFVRRACESQFGFEGLQDMLALCSRLARRTVVGGIDRAADLQVAMRAGAQWLQGHFLGDAEVPTRRHSLTTPSTGGGMDASNRSRAPLL